MKLRKRTEAFVNSDTGDSRDVKAVKQPFTVLRRTASEIRNYRIIKRYALIIIAIAIAVLLIIFGLAMIYDRTGRFSVSIKNPDKTFVISLSETTGKSGSGNGGGNYGGGGDSADSATSAGDSEGDGTSSSIISPDKDLVVEKTARLVTDGEITLTNMCGDYLEKNIDNIDGDHSTTEYLAYTFYCWNTGKQDVSLLYELDFNNITNGVDEAVRVRLYVEGEFNDYAKTRSDGLGKEPHYCDYSFAGQSVVCYGTIDRVIPNDFVKFTVVVWLEGDDPDCNDSIIGGTIKFDMGIEAKAAE